MQPAQKEKTPLELPRPEEKLLRSPTFFEKYPWIKPAGIILALIITVIFSTYFLLSGKTTPKTTVIPVNTSSQTPPPSTTKADPYVDWKSYSSVEGKYSIKYPPNYITRENTSTNTLQIYSNTLPGTDTNFKFNITHKPAESQTLQQLIDKNKICEKFTSLEGKPSSINGTANAQLYVDTPCGSYPTTIVYTINKGIFYIITIQTQNKFSEIKQYTDQIFSTLKFLPEEKTDNYNCPATEYVNCMPSTNENPYCTEDYLNWAENNCPNFKVVW